MYLEIFINARLNWSFHIQHLTSQLVRYCQLLYRICKILKWKTLYYSRIYSRIWHTDMGNGKENSGQVWLKCQIK